MQSIKTTGQNQGTKDNRTKVFIIINFEQFMVETVHDKNM